jgi:1-aminocyclopropane-1-carboxylate deaminase/D-cysteine desulfhydrase-like pyridoxal-dependent ACC family enzyme
VFCYRGYIEAVREIEQQIQLSDDVHFDDIVVACGRYFSDICRFLSLMRMEVVTLSVYDLMIELCAVVEQ